MIIKDNDLLALISKAKSTLVARYDEYNQRINDIDKATNDEIARLSILLNQLENQLDKITHPKLRKKLKAARSQVKVPKNAKPNFGKLVYYIKRLELIEHPDFKFENAYYCNTLMNAIAKEYKILENDLLQKQQMASDSCAREKQALFDEYKTKLSDGKNRVIAKANELAIKESKRTVDEIKARV